MQLALSEKNELIEPTRDIPGTCPLCNAVLIPKIGRIRLPHWAHHPKRDFDCDPWSEHETQWHRQWKECVPKQYREKVIEKNGVKHRADIQLESGVTFEFQRNSLSVDERESRESFYRNLIWVLHFPKEKLLDTDIRKMYLPTFDDSLIQVSGFSQRFQYAPHPCPIFLDFTDGEMFWIREFDESYNFSRAIRIYGRFLKKEDFLKEILSNTFFSQFEWFYEWLKIKNYHAVDERKHKEFWETRKELQNQLQSRARNQVEELQIQEQSLRNQIALKKFDDYNKKRDALIKSIARVKNEYIWGVTVGYEEELKSLEDELKKYPLKEPWDDLFWD